MSPFTFTSKARSTMEKLSLGKKSNKKISSLIISSPIEGSFEHHPSRMPDFLLSSDSIWSQMHANITFRKRQALSSPNPPCHAATPISSSSPRC